MKKILVCLLLLANLSTGLAFALDSHPEGVVGHDSVAIELLANSDHDHSDGDLHHNDHCGHAAAHLLGLIFNPTTSCVVSSHHGFMVLSQTPTFLYIAPLLRPPIA